MDLRRFFMRHARTIQSASCLALLMAALLTPACVAGSHKDHEGGEWMMLFDGNNLDGWEQVGGQATYEVQNNAIVGTSGKGPNAFLFHEKTFKDFELVFEVKLDDNPLNSGVQVRSHVGEVRGAAHLIGPQVEIEAAPPAEVFSSPPGEAGYIYGEGMGTGWLTKERQRGKVFKNGQWNKFRVKAKGDRIQTFINGKPVADLTDERTNQEGVIGLQVHSVPDNGNHVVRWRNIKIRPLNGDH
jgi:hypothetical protein